MRFPSTRSPLGLALYSVAIIVACGALIVLNARRDHGGDARTLRLYCAAGLRPVMEAIKESYESEYGVEIDVDYAGSGALLGTIRAARDGDLYLAADAGYIDQARRLGLVEESMGLASQRPALIVRKGNPKGINGLDDLLAGGVKFAVADPAAAAVGRTTRDLLKRVGRWKQIRDACRAMEPTVTGAANLVRIGTVDAAFTWDATVFSYPELEVVNVPELAAGDTSISIGVLTSSRVPTSALRFARYVAARDRGLLEFARRGLRVVEGDVWAEIPRILFFCGAMLRPGISEVIRAFERREGCEVDEQYDGCGRLVASMKAGAEVDAYVSCDRSFMDMVQSQFAPPIDLTENDIVMVVPAGNPKGISAVKDLARPGLRVGRTNPEFSALGALTKNLLERAGHGRILDAHPGGAATADELILSMIGGALDVAIVYRSNVLAHAGNADKLGMVALGLPGATAFQNFARSLDTDHGMLIDRLFERLRGLEARERFLGVGFRWVTR